MDLRIPKSKSSEWCTPQWLFDELNSVFDFTVDGAATAENAKCKRFWTKEQDGTKQCWANERIFVNPPFDKKSLTDWVMVASTINSYAHVVLLVPVKSDQSWWSQALMANRYFIKGRVRFEKVPGTPFKNTFTQPVVVLHFCHRYYLAERLGEEVRGHARQWDPKVERFKSIYSL